MRELRSIALALLMALVMGTVVLAMPRISSPSTGRPSGLRRADVIETPWLLELPTIWYPDGTCVAPCNTVPPHIGARPSVTSTLTHPAISDGSTWSQLRRMNFLADNPNGELSGMRHAGSLWLWAGDAENRGGYFWQATCTNTAFNPESSGFVGLGATTLSLYTGTTSPTAVLNTIGFLYTPGDTTWSFCSNNGSGTATCQNLGSDFPLGMTDDGIDFRLYMPRNGTEIQWQARRLSDPTKVVSGTKSTKLPAQTTFLSMHLWMMNNTGNNAPVPGDNNECTHIYASAFLPP